MFAEHKIEVKPAVMYRTVSVEWKKEEPFDYDMIVLFTPSGVQSIKRNFPDWEQGDTLIAAFGQNTVQALEDAGFHADIKVPTPECPSITAAIEKRLEQQLS